MHPRRGASSRVPRCTKRRIGKKPSRAAYSNKTHCTMFSSLQSELPTIRAVPNNSARSSSRATSIALGLKQIVLCEEKQRQINPKNLVQVSQQRHRVSKGQTPASIMNPCQCRGMQDAHGRVIIYIAIHTCHMSLPWNHAAGRDAIWDGTAIILPYGLPPC